MQCSKNDNRDLLLSIKQKHKPIIITNKKSQTLTAETLYRTLSSFLDLYSFCSTLYDNKNFYRQCLALPFLWFPYPVVVPRSILIVKM